MRFFVVLTSFLLASLSMANDADQTQEREDMLAIIDMAADANQQVLEELENYRNSVVVALAALGAEKKTVAEWREQWMCEGKTERIARYLTGKDDNARLWYLDKNKADIDKMAELGMGHIRIEYIEHWQMFNKLTDKYNMLTKDIVKLKMEKLALDIKKLRERLADLNKGYDTMHKDIKGLRKKMRATKKRVKRMLKRVKAQNLGLQFVLAFQQGMIDGLQRLDQAEQTLGGN